MPEKEAFYTPIYLYYWVMQKEMSGLPDLNGLGGFELRVYEFVLEKWPSTPLEVAEHFGEDLSSREKKKRLSTKYAYHLKKLVEKRLLLSKKAGNSILVWPFVVEKYRAIHEILNDRKLSRDELFFAQVGKTSLQSARGKKTSFKKKSKGGAVNA